MRNRGIWMLAVGMAGAGCATSVRMKDVPRVDLAVAQGGNRGYLVGNPPATTPTRPSTRQMIEAIIELPGAARETPGPSTRAPAGRHTRRAQDAALVRPGAAGPHDTYVVQPGDSLWSIAGQPNVYGKAARWRRIYEANRDLLETPDGLQPGMSLKIPRGGEDGASADERAVTSKK